MSLKGKISLLMLFFSLAVSAGSPAGILETVKYPCSTSEGPSERKMLVYLPGDYYETQRNYPVLYLIHGARGTETAWVKNGDLLPSLDSLVAGGKAEEMIVVMPNMNHYEDDKDFADSRNKAALESFFEVKGGVEKAFVSDVVDFVDERYRTVRSKRGRAIAGLSVGALQSIWISAHNPDTFDYVGLFSPLSRPFFCSGRDSDFYRGLPRLHKAQFADPPALYWIMIGRWDIFRNHMEDYASYLDERSYPYELLLTGGGHGWRNWKPYCILFMERLWK